jgi:hypothetical protein
MTTALPASVEADVNYLLYKGQRPVSYAYPAPPGVRQPSGEPLPTRVLRRGVPGHDEPGVREVMLIKMYDSLTEGTTRLSFHTAFDDPTTPADAPPRRSIELRTLVLFDS